MQAGLVLGAAAQVDGLVARISDAMAARDGAARPVAVVASGGLAPLVVSQCTTAIDHVPDLTSRGLRSVFARTRAAQAERVARAAARRPRGEGS